MRLIREQKLQEIRNFSMRQKYNYIYYLVVNIITEEKLTGISYKEESEVIKENIRNFILNAIYSRGVVNIRKSLINFSYRHDFGLLSSRKFAYYWRRENEHSQENNFTGTIVLDCKNKISIDLNSEIKLFILDIFNDEFMDNLYNEIISKNKGKKRLVKNLLSYAEFGYLVRNDDYTFNKVKENNFDLLDKYFSEKEFNIDEIESIVYLMDSSKTQLRYTKISKEFKDKIFGYDIKKIYDLGLKSILYLIISDYRYQIDNGAEENIKKLFERLIENRKYKDAICYLNHIKQRQWYNDNYESLIKKYDNIKNHIIYKSNDDSDPKIAKYYNEFLTHLMIEVINE